MAAGCARLRGGAMARLRGDAMTHPVDLLPVRRGDGRVVPAKSTVSTVSAWSAPGQHLVSKAVWCLPKSRSISDQRRAVVATVYA